MLLIMSWSQAKKTKKHRFSQFFCSLLFSILFDSTECRYDNLFFDFVVCFQSEGFVWITVSITHKHGLLTVNFISLPHAHVSGVKQLSAVWLKSIIRSISREKLSKCKTVKIRENISKGLLLIVVCSFQLQFHEKNAEKNPSNGKSRIFRLHLTRKLGVLITTFMSKFKSA